MAVSLAFLKPRKSQGRYGQVAPGSPLVAGKATGLMHKCKEIFMALNQAVVVDQKIPDKLVIHDVPMPTAFALGGIGPCVGHFPQPRRNTPLHPRG